MTETKQFKDPTRLTKWTVWFLYLQMTITVAALGSGYYERTVLVNMQQGVYETQEQALEVANKSDVVQGIVGIGQLAIYIIGGVLILKWLHRANYNARRLGAEDMRFTPRAAAYWYFVPVFCLWKPYQSMKEIWQASNKPGDWKGVKVPSIVGWWWCLWVVSNILGNAVFQFEIKAESLEDYILSNKIMFLSDALTLPLCLVFLFVVRSIHVLQMAHFQAAVVE